MTSKVSEPSRPESIELSKDLKGRVNSFLRCRTSAGDGFLVPVIQTLVRAEGGVHSNGAFMALDGSRWVSVPTNVRCDKAALALVENTALSVEHGGQGSSVVQDLLRRVSERLYATAKAESEQIKKASRMVKMKISGGDGEEQDVGERHCLYHDDKLGEEVTYSAHALITNLERLQPDCCMLAWFVAIALQPDDSSNWTFDALDGTIRSGDSVVQVSYGEAGATRLTLRAVCKDDRLLLDAGHDLSAIADINAFFADSASSDATSKTKELREDMEEADRLWEEWFPEEGVRAFLLYTIAERMLCEVRKECFVLETPSDRGKSALLLCLTALAGTYARLLPKAGLDGSNKRTARVTELTHSKLGVRMILHDEADRVDWEYLKAESNGATGSEFSLGMGETLEVAYKAMRVITKNAARLECTVLAAPIDVRRKIVHITGDSMDAPTTNPERYAKIKSGNKRLARGLFLSVMRVFHEHDTRPTYPDVLRAGTDLIGSGSNNATASDNCDAKAHLVRDARRVFSQLYSTVGKSDDGTETCVVQKTVSEKLEMTFLSSLPMDLFMSNVLHAGCNNYAGDKIVVPESCRGYVNRDGKRQRVGHALAVKPVKG
jgi:hypothetical protein